MNRTELHHQQRGTSTLEFIVVLPILLLVFFAIMELSRAWLTVNITTTATREAARMGSVTDPLPGDVFDPTLALVRINDIMTASNMIGMIAAPPTVICPTPCVSGSSVTANVQVTFDTVMPVFLPMLVGLNINRTTIMRYE